MILKKLKINLKIIIKSMLKWDFSTNAHFEIMVHIILTDFLDLLDGYCRAVWLGIDSVERTIRSIFCSVLQVLQSGKRSYKYSAVRAPKRWCFPENNLYFKLCYKYDEPLRTVLYHVTISHNIESYLKTNPYPRFIGGLSYIKPHHSD